MVEYFMSFQMQIKRLVHWKLEVVNCSFDCFFGGEGRDGQPKGIKTGRIKLEFGTRPRIQNVHLCPCKPKTMLNSATIPISHDPLNILHEAPGAMWTEILEIPPVTRKRFYRFKFEKQQRGSK